MDLTNQPQETVVPSHKTRYKGVNGAWPENLPVPTGAEAIAGVRLLYRKFLGRPFRGPFKLTSGRRHTWPRRGVYYVNPNDVRDHGGGWRAIAHAVGHLVYARMFPRARGHGPGHAHLEKQIIEHIVTSGWLDGKLRRASRPAKPKPDPKQVRFARATANLQRWESKQRRATTAIKKLKRQIAG